MSDLDVVRHSNISFDLNTATNNVPTAFSTAAGSLVLSGILLARGLCIVNETTSRISINFRQGSTTSAPTLRQAYVPAAPSGSYSSLTMDNVDVSSTIYIQSESGSVITVGHIYGWVW